MKKRLYLVQVNQRYGENVYLPYSVGLLWAYAKTFPEIVEAYDFQGFLYLKERVSDAVDKLEDPDLVGISCYIWNWEWSKAFARAVKERWPECVVVVGGVQVPDESPRVLEECSDFDFAVYGEGEGAFVDFLREHVKEKPDYASCGSLVYRDGGEVKVCVRRPFTDLAALRSPYLDEVFGNLFPAEKRWQVLQETNRGCSYGCNFCAWGQAAMNDLRRFPEERVLAEIDWFGQHKVDYLDNADANYGIVKRDVDFTRALAETKAKYGFPRTFRTSFAKNSNEVVWDIANILHNAEMLKSVTLAMQSMDDGVLVNINRKNIKFNKFGDLIRRYEEAGIPTYTELILGLPGETLDVFLDGVEKNLDAGQHSGLFIYNNLLLENTEQRKPEYMREHGLRAVTLQAMLTHGTPAPDVVREMQDIIVETAAMPHEDWKRAYLHGKVVEVFHAQGLLQNTAIDVHEKGVRYRDFYGALLDWCLAHPETVAGREVVALAALLDRVFAGGSWDCVDPRLGEISWPPEEFAFARICCELDTFYVEIAEFLSAYEVSPRRDVTSPAPGEEAIWARDVVWYGRKGAAARLRRRRIAS